MVSKFTRKDFLEALFGQYYREHRGFVLVKSVKQKDPKMSTRYFPNIEILAKEQYAEDRDVYFGICPRERMKPETEHVLYVTALWADMDIGPEGHGEGGTFIEKPEQAAKVIRNFPRPPSIAVDSGRGLHLYWLLDDVTSVSEPETVERILKKIHLRLHCKVNNRLDTLMRLPETFSNKVPGGTVRCQVTFINPNFRYSLADFENLETRVSVTSQDHFAYTATTAKQGIESAPLVSSGQLAGDEAPQPKPPEGDSSTVDESWKRQSMEGPSRLRNDLQDRLIPFSESLAYAGDDGLDTGLTMISDEGRQPLDAGRLQTAAEVGKRGELERLAASRTEVEIALLGSEITVRGIVTWNEGGLIGVQTGELTYTIPLTSVSFIRYRLS
ncbi:MAG: hypothetical protein NTW27_02510 [Deltaproteobacteria bacterium]|nr:hypothetical protein [Deltaproteobacteria bacterium]